MKLWTVLQLIMFGVLCAALEGKIKACSSYERMVLSKVSQAVLFPREFQTDLVIANSYEAIL